MKKRLTHIFIAIILSLCCGFIGMNNAKAATATISVRTSVSSLVVGNNVTATVTVSSTAALGAWDFNLAYTSSKLRLVSSTSDLHTVGWGDGAKRSASYTYTFRAIDSGKATIYISSASVADFDTNQYIAVSKGSASVSIITKEQLEESYSKNNNLSSLTVTGAELSPAFNKSTTEYTVQLPPETTKITVNAAKEDSKASITGAGEINVSDGDNRIEIKVTAENGNVRTYVINATVKEYDPIEVTVNGEKLSVVRKKSSLTAPSNYTETTATISNQAVPAFTNEITKFILVGLKDSKGNIKYYIYNSEMQTYTLYQELTFNKIILYPMEIDKNDIPKGYKKTTITYNNVKVDAYKLKTSSKFALLYGMNVETGKKSLYIYDSDENTLQRYNNEELQQLNHTVNTYLIAIIVLGVMVFASIITAIVILIKRLKKGKNIPKFKSHKVVLEE